MRPRQLLQGLLLLALQAAPAQASDRVDESRLLARAICSGQLQAVETFAAQSHPDFNAGIEISDSRTLRPLSLALTCLQSQRQNALPEHVRQLGTKPADEAELVTLLLRLGADPVYQEPDLERRTPLHLLLSLPADQQGEVLKILLENYADKDLTLSDAQGKTPKALADEQNPALAQVLSKYQPSGLTDMNIRVAPFAYAAGTATLNRLRGEEALSEAFEQHNLAQAKALLAKGVSPDLYLLDPAGRPLFQQLALNDDKRAIELLLKYHANPRIRDYAQREVLHLLAAEGQPAQIRWLAALGASLTTRDSEGESPLFAAVRAGKAANVTTLLRLGADKNLANHASQTPLELAQALAAKDKALYSKVLQLLSK